MSRIFPAKKADFITHTNNTVSVTIPGHIGTIHITLADEGVVVDVFDIGGSDIVASTWALYSELEYPEEEEKNAKV